MRNPALALLLLAAVSAPAAAQVGTLYNCPNQGSSGDQVDRGFYVTNYPGSTLEDVTLNYSGGSGNGTYTVSLTPRLSTYGGTIVGSTQTQAVNFTGAAVLTTFNFGGAPVPPGSTVTFEQVLVSGPVASPVLFYDVGVGPCANVTQTNGTAPPLDSFRRDSVGVTITGSTSVVPPASAAPIPTLGQLAIVVLSALLALGGLVAMRRRERPG